MRAQVRGGWRARCAATDTLLHGLLLTASALAAVAGFLLFAGLLAGLLLEWPVAVAGMLR
jgi:hypothetical protein